MMEQRYQLTRVPWQQVVLKTRWWSLAARWPIKFTSENWFHSCVDLTGSVCCSPYSVCSPDLLSTPVGRQAWLQRGSVGLPQQKVQSKRMCLLFQSFAFSLSDRCVCAQSRECMCGTKLLECVLACLYFFQVHQSSLQYYCNQSSRQQREPDVSRTAACVTSLHSAIDFFIWSNLEK